MTGRERAAYAAVGAGTTLTIIGAAAGVWVAWCAAYRYAITRRWHP